MTIAKLLRSRLILVTGKGGTGKTSLAAAMGLLSAERGRKTLLVEVDNFHPSFTALLGKVPGYEPQQVAPNLSVCNVTWKAALEDWLEQTVPVQRVAKMILNNRIATVFLDATPGAREIVILSRILNLAEQWDQVIVDLPASGHALGLLRVPRTAIRLLRTGPVRERAEQILAVFRRPTTALAIVSLPEEMVVNETIELWEKLRKEVPELQAPQVLLNRASDPSLTPDEVALLSRLEAAATSAATSAAGEANPEVAELLQAGRWEEELERATAEALKRLQATLSSEGSSERSSGNQPIVTFPRLGALGGFEGGPDKVVRQMSRALSRFELAASSASAKSETGA